MYQNEIILVVVVEGKNESFILLSLFEIKSQQQSCCYTRTIPSSFLGDDDEDEEEVDDTLKEGSTIGV